MTTEMMYELFENGYTFTEFDPMHGCVNTFELADLELINILEYTIEDNEVLIYNWEWDD